MMAEQLVDDFFVALAASRTDTHQVYDIGANDGTWSYKMIERSRQRHVQFHMFEPQPRFARRLRWLAASTNNASYIAAAADTTSSNATFYETRDTSTFSRLPNGGRGVAYEVVRNVTVPTIDLARYMRQHLNMAACKSRRRNSSTRPLILVKLDVEAAEYALLPALLASPSPLCCASHFLVEWHLPALPLTRRVTAGLGLRLALRTLVKRECGAKHVIKLAHHDDHRTRLALRKLAAMPSSDEALELLSVMLVDSLAEVSTHHTRNSLSVLRAAHKRARL